jgi:hypothetical protein
VYDEYEKAAPADGCQGNDRRVCTAKRTVTETRRKRGAVIHGNARRRSVNTADKGKWKKTIALKKSDDRRMTRERGAKLGEGEQTDASPLDWRGTSPRPARA